MAETHPTRSPHATHQWTRTTSIRPLQTNRFAEVVSGLMTAALVAGSLGMGSTGCGDDRPGVDVTQTSDRADAKRVEAETKIDEAERAIADYEYAQREQLVADVEHRLQDMQARLDEMEKTMATSSGEEKLATQIKLAELRTRWKASKKELDAAEAAMENEWESAKRRLAIAYASLQDSVNTARQRTSDTIAPGTSTVVAGSNDKKR